MEPFHATGKPSRLEPMSASGTPSGTPDAVVVGSGPNGLAAALTLARAGLAVHVFEGANTLGGGCRTEDLTLPGFAHDVCSTVHPLLAASPFFTEKPLAGLALKIPEIAFAHPLDGGRAAAVSGSVEQTAMTLGADARAYRRIFAKLVKDTDAIVPSVLAPLLSPRPIPWPWLASACLGCGRRRCLPVPSRPTKDVRCWPDWAPIRCDHSARLAPARSRCCSVCLRMPLAGRLLKGGACASSRRWSPSFRVAAVKCTAATGSRTCASFRKRRARCST